MRLKKIKGASDKILKSDYVINKPDVYKGKYKNIFNNNNPIHLEIGTGKGNFIIEKALRNPNINYMGIEKYDSVLIRAIEKLEGREIPNLRFINDDAIKIELFFESEIDVLYLNFSDPWPKKRHAHRRLTSGEFLKRYESIFLSNPHIIMKTDNRLLFEYSLKSLTDNDYKIKELSLDLHNSSIDDNIMTEYEEKFSSKGFVIYMMEVIKMDI
ncbi:MAG: tRNA (guanosine(46)-N7)-methyltransferase TrmB [Bacilli bacterium]|nr:tRNA (guanosine(46)-N7)-methyltransferase TrmB [Bacilli bacterium]MDD4718480.1 tRNA (guanosine(46)-N7)-methyltransferase TrmB [Bacilli bacterium]